MTMTDDREKEGMAFLDDLFAEARGSENLTPSDTFMDAIMQDAQTVAADWAAPTVVAVAPKVGLLATFWAALGGWAGAGGLVSAAAVGVWIGFAPPSLLDPVNSLVFGDDTAVSIFASDDILGLEG